MTKKNTIKLYPTSTFAVLAAFVLMALSPLDVNSSAFASVAAVVTSFLGGGSGGGIGDALCTVVGWITDEGAGQAIASLAVIFLGIQAFFGKVNWGTAVMYTAGIFAIFGSDEIVSALTSDIGGGGGGGC